MKIHRRVAIDLEEEGTPNAGPTPNMIVAPLNPYDKVLKENLSRQSEKFDSSTKLFLDIKLEKDAVKRDVLLEMLRENFATISKQSNTIRTLFTCSVCRGKTTVKDPITQNQSKCNDCNATGHMRLISFANTFYINDRPRY